MLSMLERTLKKGVGCNRVVPIVSRCSEMHGVECMHVALPIEIEPSHKY